MSAIDNLNNKVKILKDQIEGIISLSNQLGQPIPDLSPYYNLLNKVLCEELELCILIDSADLIKRDQCCNPYYPSKR